MSAPNLNTLPVGQPPSAQWVIVTQVKSHRVVYFTDDPHYQPAMEGDWYYYSPFSGAIPAQMTLRNCWGWRFNGGIFTDARGTPAKSDQETLFDSNRKTLLALLREKIDTIREPFLPSCKQGDAVRQIKLREAQVYLELGNNDPAIRSNTRQTFESAKAGHGYSHLQAVATARNISLYEAAELIVAKAEETQRVLLQSERFRESLTQAIHAAQTHAQLLQIRTWLLDQVYPELSREFKFRIENTEPIALDKPIPQTHRQHEVARLKAQLREVINAQRAATRSDYVHNDEIRKRKAQLASAVLQHGGKAPPGLDITLLETYAEARQLNLVEAAQLIVNSMTVAAEVLAQSEMLKDRMLARIEAVNTLADIRAVAAELAALEQA